MNINARLKAAGEKPAMRNQHSVYIRTDMLAWVGAQAEKNGISTNKVFETVIQAAMEETQTKKSA
jgi:hypothetical protein